MAATHQLTRKPQGLHARRSDLPNRIIRQIEANVKLPALPQQQEGTMSKEHRPVPPGYKAVYTAKITLRSGKILYAWKYGLRAFRILVRDE